ncbi:uncharacterized protein ARMOST_05423 [Armillaria ostoyae]|uniref:Coenzyme Q-binding protein COQ10 START domain-containing protein n=1 Tax=Armillaria ostoyae TaxID=47428 RepID=A0A284R075_ARMOS|nr:uncharacterized protein ARMOST_05423 [Armillaria ostoyae]
MDAELTVGFMAFQESYVSKVTCTPFSSVEAIASSSTPMFKSLKTIWRFQPAGEKEHHTLVSLDLAFDFVNPLYTSLSSAFFDKVSGGMVSAFEKRCDEVCGRGHRVLPHCLVAASALEPPSEFRCKLPVNRVPGQSVAQTFDIHLHRRCEGYNKPDALYNPDSQGFDKYGLAPVASSLSLHILMKPGQLLDAI